MSEQADKILKSIKDLTDDKLSELSRAALDSLCRALYDRGRLDQLFEDREK